MNRKTEPPDACGGGAINRSVAVRSDVPLLARMVTVVSTIAACVDTTNVPRVCPSGIDTETGADASGWLVVSHTSSPAGAGLATVTTAWTGCPEATLEAWKATSITVARTGAGGKGDGAGAGAGGGTTTGTGAGDVGVEGVEPLQPARIRHRTAPDTCRRASERPPLDLTVGESGTSQCNNQLSHCARTLLLDSTVGVR